MVSLTGFRYEESNGAYVKNKVKGGKTPYGAVAGGNGTFIMAGDPPQVIFGIKIDSKKTFKDMYSIIKHNSSRRITKCF